MYSFLAQNGPNKSKMGPFSGLREGPWLERPFPLGPSLLSDRSCYKIAYAFAVLKINRSPQTRKRVQTYPSMRAHMYIHVPHLFWNLFFLPRNEAGLNGSVCNSYVNRVSFFIENFENLNTNIVIGSGKLMLKTLQNNTSRMQILDFNEHGNWDCVGFDS